MKALKHFFLALFFLSTVLVSEADIIYGNKQRGYGFLPHASTEGLILNTITGKSSTDTLSCECFSLNSPVSDFDFYFRSKSLNGAKYARWGIKIIGEKDTIVLEIIGREIPTMVESTPGVVVKSSKSGVDTQEITVFDKINPREKDNLWNLRLKDGIMEFSGGRSALHHLIDINFSGTVSQFIFFVASQNKLLISDLKLIYEADNNPDMLSINPEYLAQYLTASHDLLEGYWSVFDRELDESMLKLGGDYKLACIKAGDGNYHLIYLEGASVNSKNWAPGDLKAILRKTDFDGIYEIEWIDAIKERMQKNLKAQIGEGNTLLIQFPYQESKLRLRKLPSSATSTSTGATAAKTASEAASTSGS